MTAYQWFGVLMLVAFVGGVLLLAWRDGSLKYALIGFGIALAVMTFLCFAFYLITEGK